MVGATGFEPATPCAQGRCATRLRYAPTSSIIADTCSISRIPVSPGGLYARFEGPYNRLLFILGHERDSLGL